MFINQSKIALVTTTLFFAINILCAKPQKKEIKASIKPGEVVQVCAGPEMKELEIPQLKVGDKYTFELPSSPSTGYCWGMLVNQPPKKRWLELIKSERRPDKSGRPGGGETLLLTLKAIRSTKTAKYSIPLYYCRPTTGEIAKIMNIVFSVTE